jgi:2-aminoethylphosphonate dioxygenase
MLRIVLACLFTTSYASYWEEKREQFEEQGFVWIQGFYSQEQVRILQAWSEQIADSANTLLSLSQYSGQSLKSLQQTIPRTLIVVPEAKDPQKVCRAEDLLNCYPDLNRFVNGTITSYLTLLFNEPYVMFKDKINFKWPGGGAFPPHQDFPAFEFFEPREHITAMVCIDEATYENGCLQIAQNWKKIELSNVDHEALKEGKAILPYEVGGLTHGTIQKEICDKLSWLPILAKPGDVVFFNSFVPHFSEINQSNTARRAMFFTLNRLKEGEYKTSYYQTKRNDPDNPMFHFGTPTKARNK